MHRITNVPGFILMTLLLGACSEMPQMLWSVDDNKPAYMQGSSEESKAGGRAPLDVPPDLRDEVKAPESERPLVEAGVKNKAAVAGKAVSLNARVYPVPSEKAFSATVDAMTALDLPVQSVDSPSGTITTEWIRRDSGKLNPYVADVLGMFGAGPSHTRYRFVVRVFRLAGGGSRIEVRTLGQQYINRHWVNRPLKRSVAGKIFTAIEERLPQPAGQ